MARTAFARISASAFAAIFGLVVVLMISGLVLTDRAFQRLHREVARADGLQAMEAIEQGQSPAATSHSAFVVIEGRDTTRWPKTFTPRSAPETVLALPRSMGTVSVFVIDHSRWLRFASWLAGLLAAGLLALGVIHERNQSLRIIDRSEELEVLYSEVARANTAKSEFLANISHELRTPLNAIVGFVELLKDGVYGELSPRQVPPVDRIAGSATHLRHLVDEVLDIAKIAAGRLEVHREPIVLRSFVFNVASELESLINERGLSLSIAVAATLPRVRTDPTHLRQILVNLIGNATKYTQSGGIALRARLVTAKLSDGKGAARSSGENRPKIPELDFSKPWVALQVIDTGIGIAASDQERIFDEFQQASAGSIQQDGTRGGTGLGLAISRRLARLLGGDVLVESELGKGSTFTLWLPADVDEVDSTRVVQ